MPFLLGTGEDNAHSSGVLSEVCLICDGAHHRFVQGRIFKKSLDWLVRAPERTMDFRVNVL